MPRTSTPQPESLADFAKLANISLEQILGRLTQAGIVIANPHEKLSPQIKAKLLGIFRKDTPKQTRVSKFGSTGSNKKVKITTLSRKAVPTPDNHAAPLKERASNEVEDTTMVQEPVENDQFDATLEVAKSLELSGSIHKKQKASQSPSLKKKNKEATSRLSKRHRHQQDGAFTEEGTETDENANLPHEGNVFADEAVDLSNIPKRSQKTKQKDNSVNQKFLKPSRKIVRDIHIGEQVTVPELARKLSIKDIELLSHLEKMGVSLEHYDEPIDQDTAALLVEELGHRYHFVLNNAQEVALHEALNQQMGENLERPPVVTVMGHVDHGKTSLLDYLRQTTEAAKEAGGITQRIGGYHVKTQKGTITFLDTPGHAAFTAMRARGAQLTDIVALVIAADDGVMPQTVEALEHAQAAKVPIVVVVNKMDKPDSAMEKIQQGLSRYNLIPEEWGGETPFIPVSAKTGMGVDQLLEALLAQAKLSELTAPVKGPAQGIIIESRLDKGRGPVTSMIVQKGTLKKGDILLAGTSFGKVKALNNEKGQSLTFATPSTPVEVLGLSTPPKGGEEAIVVPNERIAKEIATARETAARELLLKSRTPQSLDALLDPLRAQSKAIHIILKADVQGSAEALKESLVKLSTEAVFIKPLMTGVGTITESDVNLAIASKAIIFGFNVKSDNVARSLIQKEKITVHYHSVIYELINTAEKIVSGLIAPQVQETILGKASVREIFKGSKTTAVAGCIVTEGVIQLNHNVRVIRDQSVIHKGKLHSLRRFKDDVKTVHAGTECGVSIKNYTDLEVGDSIEGYETTVTHKQ